MHILKRLVRGILRAFGLRLIRILPASEPSPKKPIETTNILALAISDVLLQRFADRVEFSRFSFIQIGANDGVSFDPIRRFVLNYGFRGVLVEPQPDVFERLKTNYAGRANLSFLNVAIARETGTANLFRFKKDPSLPAWADVLASFSRETLVENYHGAEGIVEEIQIPTISLNELFKSSGFEEIDLLQIDAEGFDYEILKMLDQCKLKPKIISFEYGFMNEEERYECFSYLNRLSYKVTMVVNDAVAYLEPEWQQLLPNGPPLITPLSQRKVQSHSEN